MVENGKIGKSKFSTKCDNLLEKYYTKIDFFGPSVTFEYKDFNQDWLI